MPRWPSAPFTSSLRDRVQRLRRYAWPGLVALALLALGWLMLSPFIFRATPGWGYDFEAYLLAAQRLARGESMYLSWTLDGPFRPGPYGLYLYAPPLAAVVLPFTALSVPAATAIWFAIRACLLTASTALMPVRLWIRLLILVLAVVSEPVLTDLNLGNVSIMVMFLSVVGWRFLDRAPGSIALAAAMALRPTFGVFLAWWLVRRQWRSLLIALTAGGALIVATLPFVGMSAYVEYLKLVRNLSDVTAVPNNMDLGSTVARLGGGPLLASLALFAGYATAIGAGLFSLRRDREVGYMVTLGATLLLSPLLWDHYLVNALIPAAFLLERGHRWGLALAVVILLWVPAPGVPLLALAATLAPLLASPRRRTAYALAAAAGGCPADGPSDRAGSHAALRTTASNSSSVPT